MTRCPDPKSPSDPPPPDESPEEALVREFAGRFLEERRHEVERIPGWLAEGRLDRVARLGHQIKGTAPTFGLPEIGAAGVRLEAAARAGDAEGVAREVEALRLLMRGA